MAKRKKKYHCTPNCCAGPCLIQTLRQAQKQRGSNGKKQPRKRGF